MFASSSSVYGNARRYPTSEDVADPPFSPYGVTKLAVEHLARRYAENWGVPVVRCATSPSTGRGSGRTWRCTGSSTVAPGEPVPVYGDGAQVRDFTYVGDVVAATIPAAAGPASPARS